MRPAAQTFLAGVFMATVLAVPAQAQRPEARCTVFVSDPRHEGAAVAGEVAQDCSGVDFGQQWIEISIERHRWYGWDSELHDAEPPTANPSTDMRRAWICRGVGTYDYRILGRGHFRDLAGRWYSSPWVRSQNDLRAAC